MNKKTVLCVDDEINVPLLLGVILNRTPVKTSKN